MKTLFIIGGLLILAIVFVVWRIYKDIPKLDDDNESEDWKFKHFHEEL